MISYFKNVCEPQPFSRILSLKMTLKNKNNICMEKTFHYTEIMLKCLKGINLVKKKDQKMIRPFFDTEFHS